MVVVVVINVINDLVVIVMVSILIVIIMVKNKGLVGNDIDICVNY